MMLTLASTKEWERPAAVKRTLGRFPDSRLIPAHFSERAVGFGERGDGATSPRTAIVLASLSLSLLFSQRAKRGNACAAALPSSVSAKLSLASHEKQWNFIWDQITKKRGGWEGGNVLKEWEIVE